MPPHWSSQAPSSEDATPALLQAALSCFDADNKAIKSGWGRESRSFEHLGHRCFAKSESLRPGGLKGIARLLFPNSARIVHESRMHGLACAATSIVPRLIGLARAPRAFVLVTDFVEGTSLKTLFQETTGELSFDRDVASSLVSGLARLHAAGIAHNDLHYGNIIVNAKHVWVVDFAMAGSIDPQDLAGGLGDLATLGRSLHEKIRLFTALRWVLAYLSARGVTDKAERRRLCERVAMLYRSQPFKRSGPDVWWRG